MTAPSHQHWEPQTAQVRERACRNASTLQRCHCDGVWTIGLTINLTNLSQRIHTSIYLSCLLVANVPDANEDEPAQSGNQSILPRPYHGRSSVMRLRARREVTASQRGPACHEVHRGLHETLHGTLPPVRRPHCRCTSSKAYRCLKHTARGPTPNRVFPIAPLHMSRTIEGCWNLGWTIDTTHRTMDQRIPRCCVEC